MKNENKPQLNVFLSNPILGGVGLIAALIFGLLTVFFYYKGHVFKEITYYVNPAKTVIFNSKEGSNLSFFYNNQKVDKDISSAQVSIWNGGKLPVQESDVLSPIELYTDPPSPIINASIQFKSRDEINLKIDDKKYAEGVIPISWRILENNDGGKIQLIYFGEAKVNIRIRGSIIGQKIIADFSVVNKGRMNIREVLFIIICFALGYALGVIWYPIFKKRGKLLSILKKEKMSIIYHGFAVIAILLFVYMLSKSFKFLITRPF